jgi:hypothetical protein
VRRNGEYVGNNVLHVICDIFIAEFGVSKERSEQRQPLLILPGLVNFLHGQCWTFLVRARQVNGSSLIALTTARIRFIGFLGVKLAMLRVAVASDKRQNRLATIIQAESRELLERWSADNPEQEVMGMGTVTQTRAFDERGPARDFLRSSHLAFVGWTANGEHMRVAWFEHGRVPVRRPEPRSLPQDGF